MTETATTSRLPRRTRAEEKRTQETVKQDVTDRPTTAVETRPEPAHVADPQSPEEIAQTQREERALSSRGMYDDDPALRESYRGAPPVDAIVESYTDPDRDMSSRLAAARSGVAARPAETSRLLFEAPPPQFDTRPTAPFAGERPDDIVGVTIEKGNRENVSSVEFERGMDEIDSMIGSNRRRLSMSFDWSRERARGERHVFTRHYYERGVLVDRFASVDRVVQIEAADKARAIEAYNATCTDVHEKIGYLALLAEAIPSEEDVRIALSRNVAITFTLGEIPDRPVIQPEIDNSAQLAPSRGSVRIGLKTIRGEAVMLYHDAMKGIFTAHAFGQRFEGKSVPEVDALLEAAITKARAESAAIDETANA